MKYCQITGLKYNWTTENNKVRSAKMKVLIVCSGSAHNFTFEKHEASIFDQAERFGFPC